MKQPSNESIPTRVSLLNRLKRWDDQESWRQFFNTYWKLIYAAAARSGLNDAEAQDVVQETVIAVAKKMETFQYDPAADSFKGWLYYLTRKRIAMQFRRRARDRGKRLESECDGSGCANPPADLEQIPDPDGFDPEAFWQEEWERNLLQAALARVKEHVNARQYQMFDLYVGKQWPACQVAEALGVTVAQVYLAKHRITTLVKEEVRRLEKQMV
jgi:RNA polymerase sigma factor (sigma-70 family)